MANWFDKYMTVYGRPFSEVPQEVIDGTRERLARLQSPEPLASIVIIGYNEELAHLIYAGSDFFLMPSRFEPCGLSQMISMRYGCLPIVRETGGLKDSVIPYDSITGEGDGFSFREFDACSMRSAVHDALACYSDKETMLTMIKNAMAQDFSFERSAKEYVALYISMLDDAQPAEEKRDNLPTSQE